MISRIKYTKAGNIYKTQLFYIDAKNTISAEIHTSTVWIIKNGIVSHAIVCYNLRAAKKLVREEFLKAGVRLAYECKKRKKNVSKN